MGKSLSQEEKRARYRAWKAVSRALKSGVLVRPKKCPLCGSYAKLIFHHVDYNKPLEGCFICESCHRRTH